MERCGCGASCECADEDCVGLVGPVGQKEIDSQWEWAHACEAHEAEVRALYD